MPEGEDPRQGRQRLARFISNKGLWSENGLVFTTAIGTSMDGDNLVERSFKPLLDRTRLSQIRFHDLRHTFAALLLTRGKHPKVIQEMLGQADSSQE